LRFDSDPRRWTNLASARVYPVIDDPIQLDADNSDRCIEGDHASGAGGQDVNKTETGLRIAHSPSGGGGAR
jgi:peptide chain release factor 2